MTGGRLEPMVRYLYDVAGSHAARDLTDEELLRRFAADGNEPAFAGLMRRHGKLVWGVCRHVLGQEQDAEDAFQATFLLLARKAASIRRGQSVGSWLYGVAYRMSRDVKRSAARRRAHEKRAAQARPTGTLPADALQDVQAILDSEVQRLPEKYRSAFVLCWLEGKSRAEAARELRCREGTVSSRLDRARKLLQQRLARRSVSLSAALAAFAVGQGSASALVPASLAKTTSSVALQIAAGKPLAAGVISSQALALVKGAMKATMLTRFSIATTLVLAFGLVGSGVSLVTLHAFGGKPQELISDEQEPALPKPAEQKAEEKKPRVDLHGDPLPEGAIARLGTLRWRVGPGDTGGKGAILPDGKTLVLADEFGGLSHWDLTTGKKTFEIPSDAKLQELNVQCLLQKASKAEAIDACKRTAWRIAYSSDGRTLARGFGNGAIEVVDSATGRVKQKFVAHNGLVVALGLSADGRVLISRSVGDLKLRVWDSGTGKKLRELTLPVENNPSVPEGHPDLRLSRSIALSPDGKILAWAHQATSSVHVFEVDTGKERHCLRDHKPNIFEITFSPDSKVLATTCSRSPVQLWDVKTGAKIGTFAAEDKVDTTMLRFSPDGKKLITARFIPGIRCLEVATRKVLWQFSLTPVYDGFLFTPDSKALIVKGHNLEPTIYRLDAATGKQICAYNEGHSCQISNLAFSGDGKTITTYDGGKQERTWEMESGKELSSRETEFGTMALSHDQRLMVKAKQSGQIHFYDTATGKDLRQFASFNNGVSKLVFSDDDRLLAAVGTEGDNSRAYVVKVWNIASAKELRRFVLAESVWFLAFASNDTSLLAQVGTGNLRYLDLTSGQVGPAFTFTGKHWGMKLSPDGKTLVCPGDHLGTSVLFWELATRQQCLEIKETQIRETLGFVPGGKLLVSGGQDGTIRFWDRFSGKLLLERSAHRTEISSFAFSPDRRWLATGSEDTTALVWSMAEVRQRLSDRRTVLGPGKLQAHWEELRGSDAAKAYRAIGRLVRDDKAAVAFLKKHLSPAKAENLERIHRLIVDLDNDDFRKRETASKELQKRLPDIEPALRKTLNGKVSAEVRRRLEDLLALPVAVVSDPEILGGIRAVQVLECVASQEAQQLLKTLARGAPEARLTQEAKASLERLGKKPPD